MKATSFKHAHCVKALESQSNIPIDRHLQKYFANNRHLSHKDRREIMDLSIGAVRWQYFLDKVKLADKSSPTWSDRVDAYATWKANGQLIPSKLPIHVQVSHPPALFDAMVASHGVEAATSIAKANNTPRPFTLRANLLKTTREALIESLQQRKYRVQPLPHHTAFNIRGRMSINEEPAFKSGEMEVQDEASQMIAAKIKAKEGDVIVDWCAGSGGKSLAIAANTQCKSRLYLHDVRASALQKAQDRLTRAGATNYEIWTTEGVLLRQLKGQVDWLLLDVPCTGTGSLRSQLEQRMLFNNEKLHEVVAIQRSIVKTALPLLKDTGRLVYSTCSILKEENQQQVQYFVAAHNLEMEGSLFSCVPTVGGMDGMFAAVMKRKISS